MQIPQSIEVPIFEKYGGKGDLASHVFAFVALRSDFIFLG